MRGVRSEALILRSVDFGESDRILHLLTPDMGRLTAIAKGARRSVRRFPGTLDFFNRLQVQILRRRSGAMALLEQATLIESFAPLRHDTRRFALGCYLLEVLDRLAPEAGSSADVQRLFRFALTALRAAATCAPDIRLRIFLELRVLEALGLRPELRRCVRCAVDLTGTTEVDFCVPDGGTVCASCASGLGGLVRVHAGTLRGLEQGIRFEFEQLDRLSLGTVALEESRLLVGRFKQYHLGIELRSEAFLTEVLRA
ncbi:MAG: DNA repair protein RecO [Myxococcota bacterium]